MRQLMELTGGPNNPQREIEGEGEGEKERDTHWNRKTFVKHYVSSKIR